MSVQTQALKQHKSATVADKTFQACARIVVERAIVSPDPTLVAPIGVEETLCSIASSVDTHIICIEHFSGCFQIRFVVLEFISNTAVCGFVVVFSFFRHQSSEKSAKGSEKKYFTCVTTFYVLTLK
jgi:hypothetical protein